jgi:hypothetical protein
MCRLSIYCDLSTQLAGGIQAILQAACLSSPLPNSTPVLQGALCSSSLMRCQGSFPCMPIPHRSQMSGCKKIAPATPSITSIIFLSAFRPRGVPGPTSKLSPRVPAQMGRRETEHEGGKKEAGKKGKPVAFVLSCAQVGCACSRGLQASTWESFMRWPVVPRGQPSRMRALDLPFIGVRRGSRCTMGGVAVC